MVNERDCGREGEGEIEKKRKLVMIENSFK
jgi:hypothetical protein